MTDRLARRPKKRMATTAARAAVGIALLVGGWFWLRSGFELAEHFSGRKVAGFLEGDWFALFGLIGLVVMWVLAFRLLRKPVSGTHR